MGTKRFPLFIDLTGKKAVVIGGGTVGLRRAEVLARFGAEVTVISPSLAREAEAIRAKLPREAAVTALCIEGETRSSEELAALLGSWGSRGEKALAFVIGGSYGLHPTVKAAARLRLSMSPMTFPHHLARVMLLEQIYRGFQILEGGKYHK